MVEPLNLSVKLVNGIVESLNEVRTNREDCTFLVDRAKQTLVLLNGIESKMVVDESVSEAIKYVNKALKRAQNAIDNCCNANCLCALLLHKIHSLELHRAEKDLNHALLQIPLAALGMISDVQDDLAASVDRRSHENLVERVVQTYQTNILKAEIKKASTQANRKIENASSQTNQEIRDIKNQIGQAMQNLGLHSDSIGVLLPTENLVNDISNDSKRTKMNKEECNQVANISCQALGLLKTFKEEALSNSLVLATLSQVNKALANAKQSIADCCHSNVFFGAIFPKSNCSRLKVALQKLESALSKITHAIEEISTSVKASSHGPCNEVHNASCNGKDSTISKKVDLINEQPCNIIRGSQPTQDHIEKVPLDVASNNSVDVTKVESFLSLISFHAC